MLARQTDSKAKAEAAASALSDHARFKSHGRFIDREQARKIGLEVDNLEADPAVEDPALGVFHATTHTFSSTAAVKLLENHLGRAFIKIQQIVQVPMQALRPAAPNPPPEVPAPAQPLPAAATVP